MTIQEKYDELNEQWEAQYNRWCRFIRDNVQHYGHLKLGDEYDDSVTVDVGDSRPIFDEVRLNYPLLEFHAVYGSDLCNDGDWISESLLSTDTFNELVEHIMWPDEQ